MPSDVTPPSTETTVGVGRRSTLLGLLTVRISSLSELLRRSSTLANRRESDLSWIEWRVMSQMGAPDPLSLGALSECLNLDAGQVSRAVKGLAARGLLSSTRKKGAATLMIAATQEGRIVHARMIELAIARYEFLISDISDAEIEQASRVLEALRDKAQILLERERAISGRATAGRD